MVEQRTRSMERRYHRALRWGVVLSALAHVGLFLVFDDASLPMSPFSAAGERRGDPRAALGGGMQAVELRAPAGEESEPDPVVAPSPEVVEEAEREVEESEPEVPEVGLPAVALSELMSAPGPVSPLAVPGRVDGIGAGDGGSDAEGRFRVIPPRLRGMIVPPDRPEAVRGREVEVWVYVSSAGRVVEDSTRLHPPTGDRRFDRRLRDNAAGWSFEAARKDGQPVGAWYRYTIVM